MTDNHHHTADDIHRAQVGLKTGLSALVNLMIPPHLDNDQETKKFTEDLSVIFGIVKQWLPLHGFTLPPAVADAVADAARVESASVAPSVDEDLDDDEETATPALDDDVAVPVAAPVAYMQRRAVVDDYAFRANHDDGAAWCGRAGYEQAQPRMPSPDLFGMQQAQPNPDELTCFACDKEMRDGDRQNPDTCQCTCVGCQMGYENQQGHMEAGGCLGPMWFASQDLQNLPHEAGDERC